MKKKKQKREMKRINKRRFLYFQINEYNFHSNHSKHHELEINHKHEHTLVQILRGHVQN
jgi:hypothetical protein